MNSRRASGLLVCVLVAGAGLRLWHARALADAPAGGNEGYHEQGVSWLSRGVFSQGPADAKPRVWRGPGFPAFAALVELPFPLAHPSHLRYATALLSAAGLCAAYLLAASLAGPLGGLAAAALSAFDPGQIASASSVNIHAFYGLALLLVACAAAFWAESPTPRRGLLFGAALGFSLLTRSTHLFALPLIFLAGARRAAWPAAALVLVMLPWTVRNASLTGRFLPLDAYAGAGNLYAASHGRDEAIDVADAVVLAEAERPGFAEAFASDEASAFPVMLELARARILARSWDYAKGIARRALALYGSWWPLLPPLALLLWRKRTRGVQAATLTLASLAAYPLIAVQPAYADAARPLAAALAGAGLATAFKLKTSAPDERIAKAGAGAFASAFAAAMLLSWGLLIGEARVLASSSNPPLRDGRADGLLAAGGDLERGIVLSDQGRHSEACAAFERAWAADASRLEAGARAGECRLKLGDAKASEAAALKLAALSRAKPDKSRAHSLLARSLAAQGRAAEATRIWGRPESMSALDDIPYGLALAAAGKAEQSRARLAKADRSNLVAAARDAATSGRAAEARLLSDALVASASRADLARALTQRARARLAANDGKGALADFEAAAALGAPLPEDALAHGALLRGAGKGAAVRALLDAALPRADGSGKARLLAARAALLWGEGKPGPARADLDAALRADADAACLNAPALAEPGRMPAEYFDACLARLPGRSRLLADRGVALWREGRKDDARRSLRAAVAADPADLPAALSLAAAVGAGGEAASALRAALAGSKEPADSSIRKRAQEMLK